MRFSALSRLVLLSAAVGACAPLPVATSAPRSQTETTSAVLVATDQTFSVGPNVRAACVVDDAVRAPKFDFDARMLSGNDRDVAGQIVSCVTTGALRGRFLSVVARRDASVAVANEQELSIAQRRARAIKAYFITTGVEANHITDEGREVGGPQPRFGRPVDVELAD